MPGNPYYQSQHWRDLRRACIKRDRGRCVVPGCHAPGQVVDHIETRPRVSHPCHADRLENVRLICFQHDAQVKEKADGTRANGGKFTIRGADANGWPLDPARRG